MCGWILLSILLLLALLVQTIRITDMKGDIFRKKCRIELIERGEKILADRLSNMTVSRDYYAEMFEDSKTDTSTLRDKVSNLEEKLKADEEGWKLSLSRREAAVKYLTDRVEDLERQKLLKSEIRLVDGLEDLVRFVAANQWLMESHRAFAEAVASVGEVAESITERED